VIGRPAATSEQFHPKGTNSMLSRRSVCTFALAVACLLPAGVALAQDKIRTVNPGKIFNDMQETKDLKQKITAQSQGLQKQQETYENDLKEAQKRRELYKPDTEDYSKANNELLTKAINYKAWQEITRNNLATEQKTQMVRLFAKIEAATAEVAKEQGLDLVIVEQRGDMPNAEQLGQLNADQVRALINQRNVMFSNGKLDITEAVRAKVDENYKNGK
jgi:Skp family chaperone for outer membrane proteins